MNPEPKLNKMWRKLNEHELRKKQNGTCLTKYCRHKLTKKDIKHYDHYCAKCRSKRFKERNPMKYFYNALRNRARRRGQIFKLSFKHYCDVWKKSGFTPGSGRSSEAPSIDKVKNKLGYVDGNVAIIPYGENSGKGARDITGSGVPF